MDGYPSPHLEQLIKTILKRLRDEGIPISELAEATDIADDDLLLMVDVSDHTMAASGTDKKLTGATLNSATATLTNKTIDADDNTLSNIGTTSIKDSAITNAKQADMLASTFKARLSTTGAPQDLNATQATSILNTFVGDSGSGGTKGLVPAPSSGDAAADKYLNADGTFKSITFPPSAGDPFGFVSIATSGGDYTSVAACIAATNTRFFVSQNITESSVVDLDALPNNSVVIGLVAPGSLWTITSGQGITGGNKTITLIIYGGPGAKLRINPTDSASPAVQGNRAIGSLSASSKIILMIEVEIINAFTHINGGAICDMAILNRFDLSHLPTRPVMNLIDAYPSAPTDIMNFHGTFPPDLKFKGIEFSAGGSPNCAEFITFQDGNEYEDIKISGVFGAVPSQYIVRTTGKPRLKNITIATTNNPSGIYEIGGEIDNINFSDSSINTAEVRITANSCIYGLVTDDTIEVNLTSSANGSTIKNSQFYLKSSVPAASNVIVDNCSLYSQTNVSITGAFRMSYGFIDAVNGTGSISISSTGAVFDNVWFKNNVALSGIANMINNCNVYSSFLQVLLQGSFTSSSPIVTGISSTSGLASGMRIYTNAITLGSPEILSVDGATQVTLNTNALSTGSFYFAVNKDTAPLKTITISNGCASSVITYNKTAASIVSGGINETMVVQGNQVV